MQTVADPGPPCKIIVSLSSKGHYNDAQNQILFLQLILELSIDDIFNITMMLIILKLILFLKKAVNYTIYLLFNKHRRNKRRIRSEAEKAKTFRVAGFQNRNFPDLKCMFLGAHAHQKHRKFNICNKKCINKNFTKILIVCLILFHFVSEGCMYYLNVSKQ